MIVALILLLDVALMCYLAWRVTLASKPKAPQDLGWLSYLEEKPQAKAEAVARPNLPTQGGRDA